MMAHLFCRMKLSALARRLPCYQSPYEQEHHYRVAGPLEDWQRKVARYCQGNSCLLFAVSAPLPGRCWALLAKNPAGFTSEAFISTGKSTAQLVAGSVWGGGGPHGFGHTWRATTNGLRTVAEIHNDGLLSWTSLDRSIHEKPGK